MGSRSFADDKTAVAAGVSDAQADNRLLAEAETGSVVVDTLRALLRIRSAQGAANLLQQAVLGLGGTITAADEAGPDALPIDISVGEDAPLLAAAEPYSLARMQLERVLPRLVEDARQAVDLLRRTERLEEDSNHDALTGLANRRVLNRILPQADEATIIMVDLDHFKRLNDTYGHAAGDAVLVAFGRLLVREVRASDISCRIGGEEFVIVAARTTVPDALALIGRLRTAWSAVAPQPVTFSAGVAAAGPSGGVSALVAADAALYRAKELGRDRTEVAPDLTNRASVDAPDSEETR